jgi:hypothetical protein
MAEEFLTPIPPVKYAGIMKECAGEAGNHDTCL